MKRAKSRGWETVIVVSIVLALVAGAAFVLHSDNSRTLQGNAKDAPKPEERQVDNARTTSLPSKPVSKDEGDSLLSRALGEFTAAKDEKSLGKIREDRLIELAESRIPIKERRGINQAIEAMYERAYQRLGIPSGVVIRSCELAEGFYKKTGKPYQEVRCVLENIGKLPVSEVWGTVSTFDKSGAPLVQRKKVVLYVKEERKPVFAPGTVVKDDPEDGEPVAFRDEPRAASVKVEITKVVH